MPRRRILLFLLPIVLVALGACNNSVFLSPDDIPGDFPLVSVASGDSLFVAAPLKGCGSVTINDLGIMAQQPISGNSADIPAGYSYIGGKPPYALRAWRSVAVDDPESGDPSHDWNLDLTVRADGNGVWIRVDQSLSPYNVEGAVEFSYDKGSYFIPLIIKAFPRLVVSGINCSDIVFSDSGDIVDETGSLTVRNPGTDPIRVMIEPFREAGGTITFTPDPSQRRLPLTDKSPALSLPVPCADGSGTEMIDELASYVQGSQPLPAGLLPDTVVTVGVPPATTRRYTVYTSSHSVTATYVAIATASAPGRQQFSIRGKLVVKRPTDYIISYEDI